MPHDGRCATFRWNTSPGSPAFSAIVISSLTDCTTSAPSPRMWLAYTPPYFAARQLIARPTGSTVASLKDLAGKKIAVVSASTADDIASREFGKTSPNIRRFESTPLIISELAGGGVDAAMGDNGVIAYRVAQNPELKTLDDKSFPEEGFGIVVKKGDKALLDKLTAGLAAIRADGSYAAIYKKWFNKDPNAR